MSPDTLRLELALLNTLPQTPHNRERRAEIVRELHKLRAA